jgi:O-acetyl-ADP-ribose deacetylase (regulator of RNase III)/predicted NAD-dependent protein-ADP-ribosyltransferase YbiA (DUF1768 family)
MSGANMIGPFGAQKFDGHLKPSGRWHSHRDKCVKKLKAAPRPACREILIDYLQQKAKHGPAYIQDKARLLFIGADKDFDWGLIIKCFPDLGAFGAAGMGARIDEKLEAIIAGLRLEPEAVAQAPVAAAPPPAVADVHSSLATGRSEGLVSEPAQASVPVSRPAPVLRPPVLRPPVQVPVLVSRSAPAPVLRPPAQVPVPVLRPAPVVVRPPTRPMAVPGAGVVPEVYSRDLKWGAKQVRLVVKFPPAGSAGQILGALDIVKQRIEPGTRGPIAVVDAANPSLSDGGGVTGAFWREVNTAYPAQGMAGVLDAAHGSGRSGSFLSAGQAKVTEMPAVGGAKPVSFDYIVHALAPVKGGGTAAQLKLAYTNALVEASKKGCRVIAFPLLGALNYGWAEAESANAAQAAIRDFFAANPGSSLQEVRFTLINRGFWDRTKSQFESLGGVASAPVVPVPARVPAPRVAVEPVVAVPIKAGQVYLQSGGALPVYVNNSRVGAQKPAKDAFCADLIAEANSNMSISASDKAIRIGAVYCALMGVAAVPTSRPRGMLSGNLYDCLVRWQALEEAVAVEAPSAVAAVRGAAGDAASRRTRILGSRMISGPTRAMVLSLGVVPFGQILPFYERGQHFYEFANTSALSVRDSGFLSPIDGGVWKTSEHHFQASRFRDPAKGACRTTVARLRPGRDTQGAGGLKGQTDPGWDAGGWNPATRMGTSDRPYHYSPLRKAWEMYRAVHAKFTSNPDLGALLQYTVCDLGYFPLENAGGHDKCWGNGADGQGRNLLGIILSMVAGQLARGESKLAPVAFFDRLVEAETAYRTACLREAPPAAGVVQKWSGAEIAASCL